MSVWSDEIESLQETELIKVEQVCGDILPGIWRNVTKNDLIVCKCSGGIANRVYLVELKPELLSSKSGSEPDKVIVRLYGSAILENIDQPRLLGDDAEIIVFHLLSDYKLGPKLLGVFGNGRIEQFISNNRPNPDILTKEVINKVMASIFARIHSLELPITRKHVFYSTLFHGMMAERVAKEGDFLTNYDEELTKIADEIDQFPFFEQLKWLDETSVKIGAKSVFCHNDLHLYNILFRSHDDSGKQVKKNLDTEDPNFWSSIMVPIDFELGSYGWRGYDLAYFLNFRYYHPCEGEVDYESIKFPDSEEVSTFVKDYLNNLSEIDPNFDPVVDNVEQMTKELELASLYTHLFLFGWAINDRRIESKLEWPKAYPYLRYKKYFTERDQFIQKYNISG